MNSNSIFTCGPFVSASIAIQSIGSGIYSAVLLSESVQSEKLYEQRLQTAIEQDLGEEEIATLQREADYYHGLLAITIASLAPAGGGLDQ
jgi:hypothetical protein